ncbi:MAG TPA: ABC transporter permease [Bacillota bacterium]|nr:ABC transporter permease [Bacillota bacterium]
MPQTDRTRSLWRVGVPPSHGLGLLVASLGPWMVVILGAKLFGDEYALGTIRRLWTEGPPRTRQLGGKLGAVCLTSLAIMVLTCLAAVLLTPVVRWFYPIPWAPAAYFPSLGQLAGRFAL